MWNSDVYAMLTQYIIGSLNEIRKVKKMFEVQYYEGGGKTKCTHDLDWRREKKENTETVHRKRKTIKKGCHWVI